MKNPKVSVIIPTYNRAELLSVCLRHIRTAPDYCEILILDNASQDKTPEIVAPHAKDDPRIRYIRNETNLGMLGNFNKGIAEARGEYLTVLCDDDLVLAGNFERKVPILDAHPEVGFVYCPWHMIDENGDSHGVPLGSGMLTYGYIGGRDEFTDLLQNNHIMMNSVLMRRELIDRYGAVEDDIRVSPSNDWDMWLRYTQHVQTAYVPEALVAVRYHSGAESQKIYGRGDLAKSRIGIWRKYLIDNENAPVLNENVWHRMRELFERDLNYWLSGDRARVGYFLAQLEDVKAENNAKAFARVNALSASATPVPQAKRSPGSQLVWASPLLDCSGYADEARNFLLALADAGRSIHASVIPTPRRVNLPGPIERRFAEMAATPVTNGFVHVSHVTAPEFQRLDGALLNIGRTMFETDRLPEGWAAACNRMDRVWVPSEFNRATFTQAGVDPNRIAVIPGTLDFTPYNDAVEPLRIEGARGFNFLSVFDWTLRKGWDVLLGAYIDEFAPFEEVALIIKTSSYPERGYTIATIAETIVGFIGGTLGRDPENIPDIILQDQAIPAERMPSLYRAADCFVLPTRGEGWGRPYMEAMAMGLPTIGTNWSGNTAFMTPENSLLLPFTLAPVPDEAVRETPILAGHNWAEPSVTELRRVMRDVFTERERAADLGRFAAKDLRKRFCYERVAEIIEEELAGALDVRMAA